MQDFIKKNLNKTLANKLKLEIDGPKGRQKSWKL